MTIDRELVQAANLLVETYGDLAPMGATIKADSLRRQGRIKAYDRWMQVARLTEEMLSDEVPAGAVLH